MRIVYGIHGYGRGHAARAQAILPELMRRHDVLLLAGGDACTALAPDYPVIRIPHLRYQLDRRGKRSAWQTIRRNVGSLLDLRERGPGVQLVCDHLAAFEPDIAIVDSCAWTHRAAEVQGVPRISFDHFGVLVYCDWPMRWRDRVVCAIEAYTYRQLMLTPERIIVASFYDAPPRREGVEVVGPVLRDSVYEFQPSDGDYLMVYFSNGDKHFTPQVEDALRALPTQVRVYGTRRRGAEGNLDFREPGNRPFVRDLSGCRAVFATAGNQLISEAMHFRKPMLLLPEDSLEQRLNAETIERLGWGLAASRKSVSPGLLERFLADVDRFAAELEAVGDRDGRAEALEAIERFAAELTGEADNK